MFSQRQRERGRERERDSKKREEERQISIDSREAPNKTNRESLRQQTRTYKSCLPERLSLRMPDLHKEENDENAQID